jgi:hypothetical protein
MRFERRDVRDLNATIVWFNETKAFFVIEHLNFAGWHAVPQFSLIDQYTRCAGELRRHPFRRLMGRAPLQQNAPESASSYRTVIRRLVWLIL